MSRKVFCIVLLAIIWAPNLWGQEYNNLSKDKEPRGFRGIAWGINLQNREDMILVSDYGKRDGRKFYKRKGDKLFIGPVKISDLRYVSYMNSFYQVSFSLGFPQTDRNTLKDVFIKAYGTPVFHADMYIWENDNIHITLFPGGVFYTYLPIHKSFQKEYDEDHQRRIRDGVDDL